MKHQRIQWDRISEERELARNAANVYFYILAALALNESIPHCPCCGKTENLTKGVSCGNDIYLCPGAAREASSRGE